MIMHLILCRLLLEEGSHQDCTELLFLKKRWLPGSMRGMEAPIVLTGIYPINWKEYSKVDDTNSGTFMYLVNRISK